MVTVSLELVLSMLLPVVVGGYIFTWMCHNRLVDRIDNVGAKVTELQFNHLDHLERRIEEVERVAISIANHPRN